MKSFWKSHFLTLCLVALDVLMMSLLWTEAWQLRHALSSHFSSPINNYSFYRAALPLLLPLWLIMLAIWQQYHHKGRISSLNQAGLIVKSSLGALVATLAVANLSKRYFDLGNSVIFFFSAELLVYLYLSRTLLRALKEMLRHNGIGLTRVAIIGAGETGQKVAERLRKQTEVGYELAGFIDRRMAELGPEVAGTPVIGNGENMVDLLLRHRVEEVFLAIPSMPQNEAFDLVVECESANVNFKIVRNDLLQVITDRVKIDEIDDCPVIQLREGRLTPAGAFLKRALDLAFSVPLMLVICPIFGLLAALVKLDSPGPVIFSHDRVGKDGKLFRLHKFRTMRVEADPYAVAPGDQSDPRITRFGKFLRRTSLDELPQFWNVICGDMSLVGPRPEMPFIVATYAPWQRRRLDVPQGLTGLWQIAGRKQLPLHYNLEYDFYYIRNWSLLLDIAILLRTIPAVVLGRGAF